MNEPKIPVTVLVQTKNEEAAIAACVGALSDFGEVVVVDSNSEDRTVEIARGLGARIVSFAWNGRYPKKKQWQLENVATRYEWILFVDADEAPTQRLKDSIREFVLSDPSAAAAQLRLEYHFSGRALKHGHRVYKTVLLHRRRARFDPVDDIDIPGMGELEGHYQPSCTGPVVQLAGLLRHDDPDPVRTWFDRHNRYSDWEAGLRFRRSGRENEIPRSSQGRVFERVPFKPVVFFVYSYALRLGFLDGRAGFDYAFALAAYYWQIGLKERELRRAAQPAAIETHHER
ncbi:glycosyltransferase family 2 protein [Demequina sp. SYSU T00039]|uniref:Glycosyltransferase family 2 protein n=1 Tax=Demequina lignilytica TaxID=3051663 RepID=A0AAW7M901_9MICO|nr:MULTISPECIES: glycosyltransferase family 2 protein [unclassified Demequina]MDN4477439.1 glycosyltransferase family 2 protein [Demequina sp. SYSU T00039-1]MDN4488210.1 glycosyltransferase family 2 protein [Demequina sp. SYSU T00039]